mmetsp:Transcript_29185/g.38376  ORF Transcript_29185/g.38376 Transcript_29185/m.38376 type:complete len:220 (+) Transcript_29185:245-904(+)|eukprot:CAMPEP_0117752298 /NCGR_PEP_ID=MMETSP0947-20121206/11523_1 /TAXON_ID=44440 /ORGANISM="Chattonella subsalsa, Strain CCMP2191" /LENGTH=219 /DNA_ID=CAMNT_0005570915 /DNA_START=232 /DNA_END=891 /DNA_ORIENTATION=-
MALKEYGRELSKKLDVITYPNSNSEWYSNSEYEITWEGTFEDDSVQILLYGDGQLSATLVSSTINDGSVYCQLDSEISTSETYQVQIALLPDKEEYIWSDTFLITKESTSSTSLVTVSGIIMYIGVFLAVLYMAYVFNQWRKNQEHGVVHALKKEVTENLIRMKSELSELGSPFSPKRPQKMFTSRSQKNSKIIPIEEEATESHMCKEEFKDVEVSSVV